MVMLVPIQINDQPLENGVVAQERDLYWSSYLGKKDALWLSFLGTVEPRKTKHSGTDKNVWLNRYFGSSDVKYWKNKYKNKGLWNMFGLTTNSAEKLSI